VFGRGQLKCDDTGAETIFRLSAKRTIPFKSAGASVQLTTGSRGVRISGSNAGYTTFRGSVRNTGYPLHLAVSPSLPPVRHRVPSHFNWSLTVVSVCVATGFPPRCKTSPRCSGRVLIPYRLFGTTCRSHITRRKISE